VRERWKISFLLSVSLLLPIHAIAQMPDRKAAVIADDTARCTAWANAFRRGVPSARVVLIPNADHHVYLTNETQVIAEMQEFLASLH
jgi:non-heme chloroperoxidase